MHAQNYRNPRHIRMFASTSDDPAVNLAAEELLFSLVGQKDVFLHLYTNRKSVVIGKHQNTWKECAIGELRDAGVDIMRRISGGGTVFHDPGNLNFSFLMDSAIFDKQSNLAVIVRALAKLGIEARANERGDILVDGRKVSGNAMAMKKGRVLHHGTLLVSADLGGLKRSIDGWRGRISTRAVESKPVPVANLSDSYPGLTVAEVTTAVRAEFGITWKADPEVEQIMSAVDGEAVREAAKSYRSWEWTYGRSPKFDADLPFPTEQGVIRLGVEDGVIRSVSCCSDPDDCVISDVLTGKRFDSGAVSAGCRQWLSSDTQGGSPGGCSLVPGYSRYELVSALDRLAQSHAF